MENTIKTKGNVIITGASGGIGSACAERFAKEGYGVIINYNTNEKPAKELEEKLRAEGYPVFAVQADVSLDSEARRLVSLCLYHLGEPTVLINNAGISKIAVLEDTSEQEWDGVINTNLKSCFFMCKYVLPYMRSARYGKIVNISSMWGLHGASCESVYSASKAGIIGLTKSLAKECCLQKINVNCVAPGFIDTKMNGEISKESVDEIIEKTPLGRAGSAEDVANAVFFLSSEQASFITGQVLTVDGGLTI